VTVPEEMPPALGRKALHLKAEISTAEARVEDGEDALRLAEPLVALFSAAPAEFFIGRPVLISEAFDTAITLQTKPSMLPGMRAARALFLEFLDDIPVTLLMKDRQKAALARIAGLPIHHGRRHGKNRYKSEGTVIGKEEEIERADAADELLTKKVRAMDTSVHEKRHLLARRHTPPRMTPRTLEWQRDALNRVVRVASAGRRPGALRPSPMKHWTASMTHPTPPEAMASFRSGPLVLALRDREIRHEGWTSDLCRPLCGPRTWRVPLTLGPVRGRASTCCQLPQPRPSIRAWSGRSRRARS
jgi:hypothetical protein